MRASRSPSVVSSKRVCTLTFSFPHPRSFLALPELYCSACRQIQNVAPAFVCYLHAASRNAARLHSIQASQAKEATLSSPHLFTSSHHIQNLFQRTSPMASFFNTRVLSVYFQSCMASGGHVVFSVLPNQIKTRSVATTF